MVETLVQAATLDPWTTTSSIAAAVSALFAAFAAGVSLWQVQLVRRQLRDDRSQRRIGETIRLSPFSDQNYIDAVERLYQAIPNAQRPGKVTEEERRALDTDLSLMRKFAVVMHFWNRIGVACYADLIDRELAKRMFRRALLSFVAYFEASLTPRSEDGGKLSVLRLFEEWK
jgi:hypothetical protein